MGFHHCLDQVADGTEMNTDACCFNIYKGEGEEGGRRGEGRWVGGRGVEGRGGEGKGGEGRGGEGRGGLSCKHTV